MRDFSAQSRGSDALAVNAKEAARMIGIGERLLWTLTNAGEIPCSRIGRRVTYEVEQLRLWLASKSTGNRRRPESIDLNTTKGDKYGKRLD